MKVKRWDKEQKKKIKHEGKRNGESMILWYLYVASDPIIDGTCITGHYYLGFSNLK